MRIISIAIVALAAAAAFTAPGASAAEAANGSGSFTVPDIPIPETPAAAAISADADTILRPATLRDFAASLGGLFKQNGTGKSITLAAVPGAMMSISAPLDYKDSEFTRAWFNTQISFSSVFGEGGEGSSGRPQKQALGIRIPFWDQTDPRLVFGERKFLDGCKLDGDKSARPFRLRFQDSSDLAGLQLLKKDGVRLSPVQEDELVRLEALQNANDEGAAATRRAAYAACSKKRLAEVQKFPTMYYSFLFAFAQTWADRGTPDKPSLKNDARYFWLTYRGGLGGTEATGSTIRFLLQARAIRGGLDTGAAPLEQRRYNSEQAALRWFLLEEDKYNIALDGAYERKKSTFTNTGERVRSYLLVADYKLTADQWLRVSMGRKISDMTGSQPTVNVLYNWGLEKKPIEQSF